MKNNLKMKNVQTLSTGESGDVDALFIFSSLPAGGITELAESIKQKTRSINVKPARRPGNAAFLTYRPSDVELNDIKQDLAEGGFKATLITC